MAQTGRRTVARRLVPAIVVALLLVVLAWEVVLLRRYSGPSPAGSRVSSDAGGISSLLRATGIDLRPRASWLARDVRGATQPLGQPTRVTIHHQGVRFRHDALIACREAIRAIQVDHQDHRGWVDIGYHLIVDPAGRVWEGRPLGLIGAHAGNQQLNRNNLGVLVLGNYDVQELTRTQSGALRRLLEAVRQIWDIPADSVYTHNEIRRTVGETGTECPGENLTAWLTTLRATWEPAEITGTKP